MDERLEKLSKLSPVRSLLEAPSFAGNEVKTARARTMNTMNQYIVLLLLLTAVLDFTLFVQYKAAFWTIILALFVCALVARLLTSRGRLMLAGLLTLVVGWSVIQMLLFVSGGIDSPLMFGLIALVVAVRLLSSRRMGVAVLTVSIVASLGLAIFQSSGGTLPQLFHHPPLAVWVLLTLSLLFIHRMSDLIVRNLEQALSQVQQQNKRREEAEAILLRQNAYLAALQDTTLDLLAQSDLDVLLEKIVRRACGLVNAAGGYLDLLEPETGRLRPQVGFGVLEVSRHFEVTKGEGVAGIVWESGQPLVVDDYDHWPQRVKEYPQGVLSSIVGVPMFDGGRVVGVIGVGTGFPAQPTFDQGVIDILSQFARLAMLAIENARMFTAARQELAERKRAEEAERELRTLAEALSNSVAALNSQLNLEGVFECIMDNAGRVVTHDAVSVILLNPGGELGQVVAYRDHRSQPFDMTGVQFLISETPNLKDLKETSVPQIIADTSLYPGWIIIPTNAWVRSHLAVVIKAKGDVKGFLCLTKAEPNAFTQLDAERLQAFADHAAVAIENARLYEEVQKLALTDILTGTYNRVFFEAELARMERSRDYPISVVIVDLDNLKETNDGFGHPAGDDLLRRTVQVLQSTFRSADVIARIGGDEFAVLLPRTSMETMSEIIERTYGKLDEHNEQFAEQPIQFSLGSATAEQGKLMEAFILADRRMYAEKAAHKAMKAKGGGA